MELDSAHIALGGVVTALAASLVAVVKYGFAQIQRVHDQLLKEQKASSKKVEGILERVLPLAESITSVADAMMKRLEEEDGDG